MTLERVVIGNAELYHGDCREVLPLLAESVAVVSDPPYGIALENHGRKGRRRTEEHMTPIDWLLSGDTGISSKTILAVMTGSTMGGSFGPDVPHDPSDFGRCYRLLAMFPEWRERLPEVAGHFPMWGPMVEAWDELTALYEEEIENASGKAPKLYRRMQDLRDDGRIAAGWTKLAPGCWQRP